MAGMLYYPGTNPPDEVIFQAVLYWDFLASIVPREHERHLNGSMRRVLDAGLYGPVNLGDAEHYGPLVDALHDELRWLIAHIDPREFFPPEVRVDDELARTWYRSSRFPLSLTEDLIEQGYASEQSLSDGSDHFISISPVVRHVLFSVAAEYVSSSGTAPLATTHGRSLYTYTTSDLHFWTAHRPVQPRRGGTDFGRRTPVPAWQLDIGAMLPIPPPGTPVQQVIDFRLRYDDERQRLARAIGRLQNELRQRHDNPREALEDLRGELTDALTDLQQAAQAKKRGWISRTVYVFIATGSVSAGLQLPPLGSVLLGTASGLAINLATSQIAGPSPDALRYTYLQKASRHLPARRRWWYRPG